MHEMEMQMMMHLSCSLNDLDNTDVESLFGLLSYISRKGVKNGAGDLITIGGKRYRRADPDKVTWL